MRRETEKLKKKIKQAPRILKFRGRRVVHSADWTWADWTKLPGEFIPLMINPHSTPPNWYRDYLALMSKLQDPYYADAICSHCAIYQAQSLKRELDRGREYWEQNGGEEAKEKFYQNCEEPKTSEFRKEDAMQEVKWRFYNELAGAENRTCAVLNYFHCPFGKEWRTLLDDGRTAYEIWEHIEFYDHHWNRSTTWTSPQSDLKWFHFGEPAILDVKSFEDILKAFEDGRLDKIIQEHERYMKETGATISSL
jgi:hypothetical protein